MFQLKNITLSVNGKFILKNFNLAIDPGDKILIAGKSGIGKSTIFNLLLGFKLPDSGTVLYKGEKLSGQKLTELRKNVGFVSQDLDIGEGNVTEFIRNIFCYKANQHLSPEEKRIFELAERFDLDRDVFRKDLLELSGGEKQRVAIIIAILLDREIYLLDEPTSALDENSGRKVIEYFFNRKDWTVIFISHDPELSGLKNIKVIQL